MLRKSKTGHVEMPASLCFFKKREARNRKIEHVDTLTLLQTLRQQYGTFLGYGVSLLYQFIVLNGDAI